MKTSFIGRYTFGLQATMPACVCKNSHLYLNAVKSWGIIDIFFLDTSTKSKAVIMVNESVIEVMRVCFLCTNFVFEKIIYK